MNPIVRVVAVIAGLVAGIGVIMLASRLLML